jgi:anti-sigma factor RsiW
MSAPHVTDQIPAYALDCLDAEETIQVEAHLAVCATCRAELEVYRATASHLGLVVPQVQPPARLKAIILRRVAESQA